ncbi:AraC family transcriptional regulator [Anoxybacillus geothermalis]|uniref:AraC family transcriptional regulator n=1 Tax=Geobacillus TaxID=129337 RepID=UPI00078EAD30|nr:MULTISPECIES: AraC family transcriptional regulator [unclassified Geobacillus]AMQ21784.1 DNA-binding response regulator [Geobacillus sp. JS12]MED4924847.1 AraC family transcriptional regulator [Anoxybacillus geothermalis]OQP04657.1 DNA-binding response regulator [Geobacillus sp. 46C-IIa]QNU28136.1 response regulator transcription factor [Geobacillus sp. 46C-IIa]
MKVAIVDDEALERKALRKMIGSHLPHAEVIAEGANGREAVEIAKQYRPDVMLIDIKMPGLDGLGAIEAIRQFDLDISFIIVSAFDLFDYARQAMRFGVKEYLVKPSRKEDVISALQRVSEEAAAKRQAEEQHRQLAERFHRLQTLVEKEWLSVLMIEDVPADEWKRWEELLPFSVVSGMFLVIQFPAGNRAEEWKRWVEERLSEQTPVRYMTGWMANGRLPVLLFQSDHDAAIAWRPAAQSLALELVSQFALRYNDTLYIGLGSPVLHLHELRSSYYEALSAVHYYAKRQKARVGFLPAEAMRPEREAEQEKQLLEAVRLGDSEQARMLSFAYVDELLSSYSLSAAWRKMDELFVSLARFLAELGVRYERTSSFSSCGSEEELRRAMVDELDRIVIQVEVWRQQQAHGKIGKAKDYIDRHYAEPLTLEEVAEHVGMSPHYFSKLFKEQFGITFIDYVTNVRIERAKEALVRTDCSLKEICFSVGYNDPNYFSRVFKKQTGWSPSEYRKKLQRR